MTRSDATGCRRCGARLAHDNLEGRCAPCRTADRGRVAQAPEVPHEFWHDEALQEALTARHMGRVIRAYRHHHTQGRHPLAQETVAGWAGLSQAQLSRIENGPSVVHLDRLLQWARVLGIPGEHLWFKLPDDGSPASETADVRRRSFLTATGAGLVGALPLQAHQAAMAASPQASLAQAVADLAAVMLEPSDETSVEPVAVAELTKQATAAWQFRQRASYEALGRLLPALITQAQTSAAAFTDADQEQAARVVVHTYNAASSLLERLGDEPLALVAADRAVRAAQALGDPVLVAAAMYRLANVLLTARRSEETRTVALRAVNLVELGKIMQTPRSQAIRGALLLTAAVAAARSSDEPGAWELMGEARAASRLLGSDHADIYAIFGPTNVAIHGVQVAVELRNGRDAVRRGQHVKPDRLPASLIERRGQFLIDVAHGHVLEGDDATAVTTLLQADQIAPQEVRLSQDVHDLTRTLLVRERAGAAPGLRELAGLLGLAG
jgi:transcriptional regulator with XRE-family HTH domain